MALYTLTKQKFVLLSLMLVAVVLLWLLYLQSKTREQVLADYEVVLRSELVLRQGLLDDELGDSFRHAEFLFRTPPINGFIRALQNDGYDELERSTLAQWDQRLKTIFVAYLESNSSIVQIRYIGLADNGRELVRVDRRPEGITVVDTDGLQEKGHRDYFLAGTRLAPEQIYLSPITLNREQGKVEEPAWPTYRVVKPVYAPGQQLFGMVVVNFDARPLLEKLIAETELGQRSAAFLLNDRGDYLTHPIKDEAFRWEYGPTDTWFTDTSIGNQVMLTHMTPVYHRTMATRYQMLSQEVVFDQSTPPVVYRVVAGVQKSVIDADVFRRQLLSAAVDITLGAVIYLLLFLYLRLSEKNRQEINLRAQLHALFQGTNNAILSTDVNGKVLSWNPAALALFNTEEDVIRDANAKTLLQFDENSDFSRADFLRVMAGREHATLETRLVRKNAESIDVSLSLSPVIDGENHRSGVAMIFHDISAAKKLQHNLETLNERLQEHNAEMEKFIYSVSHDLKAPLVTIGSFTEKILTTCGDTLDEKNRHRLNRIIVNTQNMAEILNELLQLSRIVREDIQVAPCRLKTCVDIACEALHQQILESNASITTNDSEHEFVCNSKLLANCLQNLIANAIQYCDPSRDLRISVGLKFHEHVARVWVKDNGMGIERQYHEQIFKIFERLDVGEGNGVGLAIVKSIVEKHGGWIELDSEPGMGSTFTLCFPQGKGDDETTKNIDS
ncbi:ATP-binding protein [Teredinibacter turnerae]|uniref:sensor histidine kinase n=1 Tax=Teredinibacter turnerae TaxID=2426 RepID=UPI00037946CE|nr:ATP-binding protein [Teredinibacter turnerae]